MPTSPAALSIFTMIPEGPAALPHFMRALRIRSMVTGGGGYSKGATLSHLISALNSLAKVPPKLLSSPHHWETANLHQFSTQQHLDLIGPSAGQVWRSQCRLVRPWDFFFLSHRLDVPNHARFHVFSLPPLTGLSQGFVPLKSFTLLLDYFFNIVTKLHRFSFPLLLLRETTHHRDCVQ